jgi:alpha-galactosidase
VDEVAAYRSGLALVRDVLGPEVYLVGCGAPMLPSIGLVDAMRVSPDTFHEGGEDGSAGLRGLMPLVARGWQQGRLWVNDPDCVVARPSFAQRVQWARAARRYGGMRSFSDRVADLDDWGLRTVRSLLDAGGSAAPLAPADVRRGADLALAEVGA